MKATIIQQEVIMLSSVYTLGDNVYIQAECHRHLCVRLPGVR